MHFASEIRFNSACTRSKNRNQEGNPLQNNAGNKIIIIVIIIIRTTMFMVMSS